MRRRAQPDDRAPVRPPQRLLRPSVEDWVTPGEPAVDLGVNPLYRAPGESETSWRYRQMASQRWSEALRQWQREHPKIDMTVAERKFWLLHGGSSGASVRWRDVA